MNFSNSKSVINGIFTTHLQPKPSLVLVKTLRSTIGQSIGKIAHGSRVGLTSGISSLALCEASEEVRKKRMRKKKWKIKQVGNI